MTQRSAAPLILATRALSHFLFNPMARFFNLKTKQRKEKKRKEQKS
jgi:phosphotransferase system  glucose/maltose/N-acetylglucosamine-specific IIC component